MNTLYAFNYAAYCKEQYGQQDLQPKPQTSRNAPLKH